MSVLTTRELAAALVDAGVFTQHEINQTTRIIIDADPQAGMVTIHVQRVGDKRLLDIAALLTRARVIHQPDQLSSAPEPPGGTP